MEGTKCGELTGDSGALIEVGAGRELESGQSKHSCRPHLKHAITEEQTGAAEMEVSDRVFT